MDQNVEAVIAAINEAVSLGIAIQHKDVREKLAPYGFFTLAEMARQTGYCRQYIHKRPPFLTVINVNGKTYFRLDKPERNKVAAHFESIGFTQKAKSALVRGDTEIKDIDDRYKRITFYDSARGTMYTIVADGNTAEVGPYTGE